MPDSCKAFYPKKIYYIQFPAGKSEQFAKWDRNFDKTNKKKHFHSLDKIHRQ